MLPANDDVTVQSVQYGSIIIVLSMSARDITRLVKAYKSKKFFKENPDVYNMKINTWAEKPNFRRRDTTPAKKAVEMANNIVSIMLPADLPDIKLRGKVITVSERLDTKKRDSLPDSID